MLVHHIFGNLILWDSSLGVEWWLFGLDIFSRVFFVWPVFNEINDIFLQNAAFSASALNLMQVDLMLSGQHLHSGRCQDLAIAASSMLRVCVRGRGRSWVYCFGLLSWILVVGFDLDEGVSDLTSLIDTIEDLLYDSSIGRCNFGQLFIGWDLSKCLKFIHLIPLPHEQLLHLALLDLLPEVRQVETEHRQPRPLPGKETTDHSFAHCDHTVIQL